MSRMPFAFPHGLGTLTEPHSHRPVAFDMEWNPQRDAALSQLARFTPNMGRRYANRRNHDEGKAGGNVSRLSPWLHAGVVSEAEVLQAALGQHSPEAAEKFIAEVFWRIYFKGYLEQRPSIWRTFCDQRDAALSCFESDPVTHGLFEQATSGQTGIEAFDHWARELGETGYLHNHARMWFASIWIFTLKLDWTLGADFFLRHLIDGDAASNTLSWRWIAGLHTKGKTYLARPDNIAQYTQSHPDGPLLARGLAQDAPPLTEPEEHAHRPLALPPGANTIPQTYALLLHDEAASHVPFDLPHPPALVISAARPDDRSPRQIGGLVRDFAMQSVQHGGEAAAETFGCPHVGWQSGNSLVNIMADTKLSHIVTSYLPMGWTRDALWPELAPLADKGSLIQLTSALERATWPHAKAGFFGVKKIMYKAMREAGVAARQLELFDA